MEKSPQMPTAPQPGYMPQRPCSFMINTTPEKDAPALGSSHHPAEHNTQYTRQNPFAVARVQEQQQQPHPDEGEGEGEDTLGGNTLRGGRGGCVRDLIKVLCAACCCYTFAEVCC